MTDELEQARERCYILTNRILALVPLAKAALYPWASYYTQDERDAAKRVISDIEQER
jgi:hypothetical protein